MIKIKQIYFEEITTKHFDVFIAASGFEQRASYQISKYEGEIGTKIVLCFNKDIEAPSRKLNDTIFAEKGFKSILINGQETDNSTFKAIIFEAFNNYQDKNEINFYIDYSSMTKNWYAYILYAIKLSSGDKTVKVTFGYSHGKYVKHDGKNALNRIVSPLNGYCNLTVPSKPTALIIGMGNEPNRMSGLKEYFDAVPYLFYSDSSYNPEYAKEIEEVNKEIFDETKVENVIKFPLYDLIYSNYLLENLCNFLAENFRIIIAPCGPKPFALLAMINALKFENAIEVWRISPGDGRSKIDREPTGLISVLEVTISSPELT